MLPIIVRRLLSLVFVVFSITFLTFAVGYLAPGDPIQVLMGPRRDPAVYQRLRHRYGLDRPWYEQYFNYVARLARGDLGLSYAYQERPVAQILGSGIPVSVELGGTALVLSLAVGVPAGVLSALRQNSWIDRGNMVLMLALYSIPSFVLVPVVQFIDVALFMMKLPHLPVAGWGTPAHLVLPVLVLSAGSLGYIARLTRASMLEVLHQDYIRTARAKGLRPRQINYRHALRNALLPLVTVVGPSIAFLVTGAFVVENLFAVPGVGYIAIQSIGQRDYPVIQATTVILATAVVVMNLVTDLTYTFLDPRIRVS
jgi:ABC-type dipeptide/oligopeptide/nickel transport system permease component